MADKDESNPRRCDEDAEAILGRRRFLIQSALVGAGLAGLGAGCQPFARPCLTLPPEPKPCLKVEETR
jgi:hypothetical protein